MGYSQSPSQQPTQQPASVQNIYTQAQAQQTAQNVNSSQLGQTKKRQSDLEEALKQYKLVYLLLCDLSNNSLGKRDQLIDHYHRQSKE